MQAVNWPPIIAALIGGGAAGAIINATVAAFRGRQQPVGHRVDLVPVFRPSGGASQLEAAIAVTNQGKTATFKNLFLAEIQVVNKGNQDLDEFPFGATLGDGDVCIHVEATPPDRFHMFRVLTPATPHSPQQQVDFALKPFNRGDSYAVKLYLVIPDSRIEPEPIALGSASPVKFVKMPTAGEIFAEVASSEVLRLGPFYIRFRS